MKLSLGKWLLPVYSSLALLFLMIPIGYTFIYSFNDSLKSNITWRGFTFDKWLNVCNVQNGAVCQAFGNSLIIGAIATVVATTLGTMIAIAIVRYRFKFRSQTSLFLFLPMATPEVVLGAGLAAQFLSLGVPKDMLTIILAHTMFCISFVVVTVKARVASLDPALEEAGRDLYGSAWQVFARITFPLLLPGILAAALLSFALSFDDFIITNFNSGAVTTFPKYIYISAARGIPAEANVLASAVFILALVVVVTVQVSGAARARRLAKMS
ncbi:MAG: ABC transporter permease [Cryobacterium sp.]|uniref:ABC transporter permease n=1 Tax=unclassified Cryobacterium TaxID=2649013 RepID=UPI001A2464E6|nr:MULTISPECIES: ABC transporter permease [unclassified Cryobacterium]MCY7405154.1 ABC transporter permease [Cryobacterium sp.]MEC5155197.1 spermidine/putrescine transport system permease protein [Cryobacterium sp. CAN_C3]